MDRETLLNCHLCGQEHRAVHLLPGERARCVRCDTTIAKGKSRCTEPALVLALGGLILAVPAFLLPFITAGKFGDLGVSRLLTGVGALWGDGMRAISMLVLFCGGLLPVMLLLAIAVTLAPERIRRLVGSADELSRLASVLERWSIPEVQVLAVLVALMKLGSLVQVSLGAGFWCYCAMSFLLLLATRSFDFESLPGRYGIAARRREVL